MKTHPAVFLLLIGGGAACWWARRPANRAKLTRFADARFPSWYAMAPHLVLIGCYLAIAMTENVNIGHRHVLPIYPSLYVLAGAAAALLPRGPWGVLAVFFPLTWLAAESLATRPHYLSYFGPQIGGPAHGYKHLVDSSVDWGMGLPALKEWLDVHNPQRRDPVFLAYFGTDQPLHYGIDAIRLPGFVERRKFEVYPLMPGYYAISASLLQGVYTSAFGPWSPDYEKLYRGTVKSALEFQAGVGDPQRRAELLRRSPLASWMRNYELFQNLRFARLCAWLRHQPDPPHHVGHAIFIWKLDRADLEAGLFGPPAELVDVPARIRQFRRIE